MIEIDNLFIHIYEDNVSGKITDDRFRNLSFNYDKEEQELKIKIEQLSKYIENTEKKDTDITQFMSNSISSTYLIIKSACSSRV